MITRKRAQELRKIIEQAVESLPDEEALEGITLFPVWAVGIAYKVDERISYEDKLYRVVQAHTSQADYKVWYPEKNTTVYRSLIDNNVWSPEVSGLWEEVTS